MKPLSAKELIAAFLYNFALGNTDVPEKILEGKPEYIIKGVISMSSKFLARTIEVSEPREGASFNVLSCISTSGENCYDGEQTQLTAAMEMMYYVSLCHVYSGEMEY